MNLNHMLLEDEYPDTTIIFRHVPLQNTTESKYLGSHISQNKPNMGDIEINYRIQMTFAKCATMTNLFQNSKIYLKNIVKFLNSFVNSRLAYPCENDKRCM